MTNDQFPMTNEEDHSHKRAAPHPACHSPAADNSLRRRWMVDSPKYCVRFVHDFIVRGLLAAGGDLVQLHTMRGTITEWAVGATMLTIRACPGGSVTGSYHAAATVPPPAAASACCGCRCRHVVQATEPFFRGCHLAASEERPAAGGGRASGAGSYQSSLHWNESSGGERSVGERLLVPSHRPTGTCPGGGGMGMPCRREMPGFSSRYSRGAVLGSRQSSRGGFASSLVPSDPFTSRDRVSWGC